MTKSITFWIVFAVGYFLSPIDGIPDIIFPLGWIDDAGVVAFAINKINEIKSMQRAINESSIAKIEDEDDEKPAK